MSMPTVEPAGFLSSVLIQAWFDGSLPHSGQDWSFACPLRRDRDIRDAGQSHEFLPITKQCTDTKLSCLCRYCRYHYVVTVKEPASTTLDVNHPQHFFRFKSAESQAELEEYGQAVPLYPLVHRSSWECECETIVNLEISSPRLRLEWINTITDQKRIEENIRRAKEEDPERYKDVGDVKTESYKTTALKTLNTYLGNILEDDGNGKPKRISVRNKTFTAQFGQSCEHIFLALGFKLQTEDGENYWLPPRLTPEAPGVKTDLGSEWAFYQDVKSEVQSVIETGSSAGRQEVVAFDPLAKNRLYKMMGCDKYAWRERALPQMSESDETSSLWALGAPAKAKDDLLKYAYQCQIKFNPSRAEGYLKALRNLAIDGGEDLQVFCITEGDRLEKPVAREVEDDMHIQEAFRVLGVGEQTDLDTVANVALASFDDRPSDRKKIYAAVERIYKHYGEKDDANLPLLRSVYDALRERVGLGSESKLPPPLKPPQDTGHMPLGLANIRNTCYLNSLLQYMYTISHIRNFVLTYPDLDLEPTERSVTEFMTRFQVKTERGWTKRQFFTGEAYLGYAFTIELRELFRQFEAAQYAETKWIEPSQRLANAALIRSDNQKAVEFHYKALAEKQKAAKDKSTSVPPLPPRRKDGEMDDAETGSAISDKTLVEDVVKETPEADLPSSGRPRAQVTVEELAAGVNSTEVKGTDQQDIHEAWNNIKDHLEAAALLIGSEQFADLVTNSTCEHKRFPDTEWTRHPAPVDYFSVFPNARGAPDLCNAMAYSSFDLEVLEQLTSTGSVAQGRPWLKFTTIEKAAPHLHIHIQRAVGTTKNQEPMNLADTIYIERFKTGPTSPNFPTKKREWEVRARLNEIKPMRMVREVEQGKEPLAEEHVTEFLKALGDGASNFADMVDEERAAKASDLSEEHGIPLLLDPLPQLQYDSSKWTCPQPPGWDSLWDRLDKEEAEQEKELSAEWDQLIESQKGDPYVLHAAFCHSGTGAQSGHYWVYIRDFENGLWRKYNDGVVTVVQNPEAEFSHRPDKHNDQRRLVYYLSYIKESDAKQVVSVPRRQVKQRQSDDVEMGGTAEHLEDVRMGDTEMTSRSV